MVLGRSSLPQEFVDATSPIMLRAPQPEFFFARLLYMAQAQAELKKVGADAFGVSPDRRPSSQGAPVPDLMDMALILNDAVRAEAVIMPTGIEAQGTGHTMRFNRPVLTGGSYTKSARRIAAGQAISTTAIDLSVEQVSLTVERTAGPMSAAGTVVQPFAIDRLDSQRSLHALGELAALSLQYDRAKYVDTVIPAELMVGANTVRPGGATTDAAAFVANYDAPMDLNTLYRAEQKADELNVPHFANGKRMCVLSPQQERQLKEDDQYWKQRVFDPEQNPLRAQYVSTVGNIEIYRSNSIVTDTSAVSGVTINQGLLFGPGSFGWGVAEAVRVAAANEDNYGELSKVIWLCYEASGTLNNTFIVNIRTD